MTSRETIWELVFSLIDECWDDEKETYLDKKEWEDKIKDIVDEVEDVAWELETKMTDNYNYYHSGDAKEDAGCHRSHVEREEG